MIVSAKFFGGPLDGVSLDGPAGADGTPPLIIHHSTQTTTWQTNAAGVGSVVQAASTDTAYYRTRYSDTFDAWCYSTEPAGG